MTSPGSRRRGLSVGRELSPREWAVLSDLARVRLLTGRQVQRLHLQEGSPLTQARRTRSLLQRMNDLGLLHRLERRIGGVSAGSASFIYGLAPMGQRLTTGQGPAGGRRVRRPWEPGRYFINHVLAVSELYVQLREKEATRELEVLAFDAEPACWRAWTGLGGEQRLLKPDAFVSVAAGDYEHRSFVEVDLSTESTNVLRRKALVYVDYWQSGAEQQRHGVFPKVVWLVPDERRRAQLVDVLSRLPAETWLLFAVALQGAAVPMLTGRAQVTAESS